MAWRALFYPLVALFLASGAAAMDSSAGRLQVAKMVGGLDDPWSVGFLPDGGVLITERGGRLLHVRDGTATAVTGVPAVVEAGQGGLLDVLVPRDFASSRQIFLSYAVAQPGGSGTALASGRLSADGRLLHDVQRIFEMAPGASGGRHFGGRIIESPDGTLFLTIGDRGNGPAAQDLGGHNGSVLRLSRNGTAPADNPFADRPGARPEIWSYGHRNPQGAALDATGQLWINEHGAMGGDEVNRVRKGANYGWPVIAYGRHYSGAKIGEGTAKAGMEQPAHYWDPSIAPSGMVIYSGKLWPEWRGDFFIGSLKFDLISHLDGATLTEIERLSAPETGRVRDIREAPDGSIWFLSETRGAAYRITPAP
ncbi:MAG: PQQ-dependent sugar dehydrogenase [Rhodobacteraceae bacterium]|nr:PQQ-dependent sugar dehydrogenase [Paracoccaceae bacterium]